MLYMRTEPSQHKSRHCPYDQVAQHGGQDLSTTSYSQLCANDVFELEQLAHTVGVLRVQVVPDAMTLRSSNTCTLIACEVSILQLCGICVVLALVLFSTQ